MRLLGPVTHSSACVSHLARMAPRLPIGRLCGPQGLRSALRCKSSSSLRYAAFSGTSHKKARGRANSRVSKAFVTERVPSMSRIVPDRDLPGREAVVIASASRTCPGCGHSTAIADNERIWPLDWHCFYCGWKPPLKDGIASLAPDLDGRMLGIDPGNFAQINAWEEGHFWFVARNELIVWLTNRYLPSAKRIMEIGCGTGYVLQSLKTALPGAHIVGSELHSAGLQLARRRHGDSVEFVQLDCRALHMHEVFDAVFALDVIEHIAEDEAVLTQIHAVLRPSGVLVLAAPQHPWLWSASDQAAHHVRRYRRGELCNKARAAGFNVVYADLYTSLLLPLMAISRIASKLRMNHNIQDELEREFAFSPRLNTLLLAVQRWEQALRSFGLRMPFGGSQVIVAHKAPRNS